VKRERLDFLADNPHFTKRFAYEVGRRCREASIRDVARDFRLDWDTVKTLDMQYMRAQLARAGTPGPRAIGIDGSRTPRATAKPSVAATKIAGGREGSAAWFGPRPAWRSSMPGWARRRAGASSWR
jgi:hypothetical protein